MPLLACRHHYRWCWGAVVGLTACFIGSPSASAGVVSGDRAIICNAAGNESNECQPLRSSVFEGRFSANLGLDLALAVRSQKQPDLSYDDSTRQVGRDFKLKDAVGVRFGLDLRLYFFDWLGIAATTGIDSNTISTPSNSSSDSGGGYSSSRTSSSARTMVLGDAFALNYTGSYVGATIYIPAQKFTHVGLFASARKMAAKNGEATVNLNGSSQFKRQAEVIQSPQEISFGCFFSIFYLNYVNRFESWRIIPLPGETFSDLVGHSEGIELGISGPVSMIWP